MHPLQRLSNDVVLGPIDLWHAYDTLRLWQVRKVLALLCVRQRVCDRGILLLLIINSSKVRGKIRTLAVRYRRESWCRRLTRLSNCLCVLQRRSKRIVLAELTLLRIPC